MNISRTLLRSAALGGAVVAFAAIAFAQTQPSYPIAQLGSCADQQSCHAYCDQPANMVACEQYGSQHGLVSASEASNVQQFAAILAKGAGPGGCSSADSCDAYCSTIANLQTCIAFAQKNGFANQDVSDGEKVLQYMQAGGSMPGNCVSKQSCQAYCMQPGHTAECAAVFTKIGIARGPGGPGQGPSFSPELLQRFSQAQQAGKTPGGCSDLMSCEQYCSDPSHGAACQIFGQAMGFGNDNANERTHRAAPPSPGGCDSKDSCDAYCSQKAHADECRAYFSQLGNWQAGSSTSQMMNDRSGDQSKNDPGLACGKDQMWDGTKCVQSHWVDNGPQNPQN